jgi:hypothetical protein
VTVDLLGDVTDFETLSLFKLENYVPGSAYIVRYLY